MNDKRFSSRARYTLVFGSFTAVILLSCAALIAYFKYNEHQRDIESRAGMYSRLAVRPICEGYRDYYFSGYFKYRERMQNLMTLDMDLTRIRLLDLNGKVLFDSENLKTPHFIPQEGVDGPILTDSYYLDAVRKLERSQRYIDTPQGNKGLEITSPYVEEWGRHNFSVVLLFTYAGLAPVVQKEIYEIAGVTVLSILFTTGLLWLIAGRMTARIPGEASGAGS